MQTMTSANDSTFPVGEIHRKSDGVPGYLAPTATAGFYDFHYGAKPADATGILSEDFAITELICGGNCGGLQLRYDTGNAAGRWLAFADSAVEGAYTVRFRTSLEGTQTNVVASDQVLGRFGYCPGRWVPRLVVEGHQLVIGLPQGRR
jgi:hypothetical protein